MTPTCSIIIRTLNESRYLGELLEQIDQQTYPAPCREVVVVDSGSEDGTLAIAKKHGCKIETISRENFSFGRSLNLGCDSARGDFLVLISGHCVPTDSNWLWNLLLPFHEQEVAVTYGRQIGGPSSKFSEKCLFEKYFPRVGDGSHQAEFFCNNANSAFRRLNWAAYRFDEEVTGLEDMQLAQILVNDGAQVRYVSSAAVVHHHHEMWRQVMRRYEREAIALRGIMPEIHVHWHDALRYFAAGVMGDSARAISQREFISLCGEIFVFRFCQFYGAWKGNHHHRKLSKREKDKYFYPN